MTMKILLENLLRHEDGGTVTADDISGGGRLGRQPRRRRGDRLPSSAGVDAGLHRRPLR